MFIKYNKQLLFRFWKVSNKFHYFLFKHGIEKNVCLIGFFFKVGFVFLNTSIKLKRGLESFN